MRVNTYKMSFAKSLRRNKGRKTLFGRFAKDSGGNIIFLFAFMLSVLFLFAGGAVDYTRWNAVRADMIESMDASSLALAQLSATDPDLTTDELKAYGRKFFEANFNYENNLLAGWDIEFTLDDDAVVLTCVTGKLRTYLLGVAGIKKLDIDKCVEITKRGSGRVELALVLDVTGSMNNSIDGKKKIDSLKDAVEKLLDVMYGTKAESDNIKIGVVPFNAYVNVGEASSWTNDWADQNANATYHGARFIHVTENGDVDLDTKVNHFTLFNSTTGASWGGCVEARPYPLDELDVPPAGSITSTDLSSAMTNPPEYSASTNQYETRMYDAFDDAPSFKLSTSQLTNSANLKWVPMFHPDEPDCNANWRGRCPLSNGYSYWTAADTFTIGSLPHVQTRWRNWFVDPSYASYNEGDYWNRHFIDDETYIGRYKGAIAGRYAKIVQEFRMLGITPYSLLSSDQKDFHDYMEDLGVNDFYDIDITSSGDSSYADSDEFILRNAYVGWWDSATNKYKYKYDQSPSITSSRGPNLDCARPVLPLTNVRQTIEDHVNSLGTNGNTNSANGALWGWRILSPEAPFTEGIGPDDVDYGKWQKAVVIMTDGNNTTSNLDTHWGSDLTAYGFERESRMGANMDDANDMEDEFDNKLLRVCYRMRQEGYLVYTIMFGLNSSTTEKVFRACATKPSEPYFYDAVDGDDLEEAFGQIAADLVDLHISK
ncbi:pilus assembly protein TadG-related protein [Hyphococcus lacteus]|uniref:TadE/TadG family type IV pilus assembly protein n=1 Tax=Hyphococcus lacteus TaxID=3143536 RepID=A0ABV3Z9H5_9PROT